MASAIRLYVCGFCSPLCSIAADLQAKKAEKQTHLDAISPIVPVYVSVNHSGKTNIRIYAALRLIAGQNREAAKLLAMKIDLMTIIAGYRTAADPVIRAADEKLVAHLPFLHSSYALNQRADALERRLQYAEKQAQKSICDLLGMNYIYTCHLYSGDRAVSSTVEAAVKSFLDEATDRATLGVMLRILSAKPKFGDWDVNDPASAKSFTMIFNKARNEKKTSKSQSTSKNDSMYNKRETTTFAKPQCCNCVVEGTIEVQAMRAKEGD
ncbi:RPM1-interacting protein 4 (RIN4) family protein [Tanacetum coccineum]